MPDLKVGRHSCTFCVILNARFASSERRESSASQGNWPGAKKVLKSLAVLAFRSDEKVRPVAGPMGDPVVERCLDR